MEDRSRRGASGRLDPPKSFSEIAKSSLDLIFTERIVDVQVNRRVIASNSDKSSYDAVDYSRKRTRGIE
jgi:hypothetical protein